MQKNTPTKLILEFYQYLMKIEIYLKIYDLNCGDWLFYMKKDEERVSKTK